MKTVIDDIGDFNFYRKNMTMKQFFDKFELSDALSTKLAAKYGFQSAELETEGITDRDKKLITQGILEKMDLWQPLTM